MMIRFIGTVALALACAAPAVAFSTPYSTDTVTFSGLGDTIGSPFDIITLNGVSGLFTGSGTYLVSTVDFTVGVNASVAGDHSGNFTDTAHAFGSDFTFSVPYTLHIDASDSITLGGSTFHAGGYKITLNPLVFANQGVGEASGNLTATVSIPEPATWAMMVVGFGLVGVGVRRRGGGPATA